MDEAKAEGKTPADFPADYDYFRDMDVRPDGTVMFFAEPDEFDSFPRKCERRHLE